jgi:hypothetical protein
MEKIREGEMDLIQKENLSDNHNRDIVSVL